MKKSLYVSRKLTNARDFISWAKSQGFETTLDENDLHVTIAYSTAEVDWNNFSPKNTKIIVKGGKRTIQPLGDQGAVVLKFHTELLPARWQEFKDGGCSWDYEGYQPHVTITYNGNGTDLDAIKPYTGNLEFGPEEFEEIKEEWTGTAEEK